MYADGMILLFLQLRQVFRLPLRQTQGFLLGLRDMMQLSGWLIPSYSQVCRRSKKLPVPCNAKIKQGERVHLVVDATGLKVYGDGEWNASKHGSKKRRVWKKLHICMDDPSFQIVHSELTDLRGGDAQVAAASVKDLRKKYDIASNICDGAYDAHNLYHVLEQSGVEKILIPPKKKARTLGELYANAPPEDRARDVNIKNSRAQGLQKWKEEVGYHRRSRVETAMYRYKQIIGERLRSRCHANQITEHKIACQI